MAVDKTYVKNLAESVQINLTDEQLQAFTEYIQQMEISAQNITEKDLSDVEPTAYGADNLEAEYREDEAHASLPKEKVFLNAHESEDSYFVVPSAMGGGES